MLALLAHGTEIVNVPYAMLVDEKLDSYVSSKKLFQPQTVEIRKYERNMKCKQMLEDI